MKRIFLPVSIIVLLGTIVISCGSPPAGREKTLQPRKLIQSVNFPLKENHTYKIGFKFMDHVRGRIGSDNTFYSKTRDVLSPHMKKEMAEINTLKKSVNATFSPVFPTPEEKLEAIKKREEVRSGNEKPDLAGMFYICIDTPGDLEKIESVGDLLENMDIVEFVQIRDLTEKSAPCVGILTCNQYYREPNPGMDVDYAWSLGYKGQGVRLTDIEWSYNMNHEDLPAGAINVQDFYSLDYDDPHIDHGTKMLGILAADTNSLTGIDGIIPDADVWLYPITNQSMTSALEKACEDSIAGDIVLIENAWGVEAELPMEMDTNIALLIETYKDKVIIIEPAGNGNINLDGYTWGNGAIFVGGGSADEYHDCVVGCYGSRVDIQNWGEYVFTTDAQLLQPTLPPQKWDDWSSDTYDYTGGTSPASALTAGACAILQGVAEDPANMNRRLSPSEMKELLKTSGIRQDGGYPIGRFVSLRRAINSIMAQPGGDYNYPPVTDVGDDIVLFYPENSTTLTASVTDDNGIEDNVQWMQLGGPGNITFQDNFSPVTQATFPVPGKYLISFMANDSVNPTTATEDRLTVYVTRPSIVSSSFEPGIGNNFTFEDLEIDGDYAYIIENGLHVIDISDIENPEEIASWGLEEDNLYDIEIEGKFAYITDANDPGTLYVLYIGNPWAPAKVGEYNDLNADFTYGFAVKNSIVYLAQGTEGIKIVDASIKTNPTLVNVYNLPYPGQEFRFLKLSGDYLYAEDKNEGLVVLNITSPLNPGLEDSLDYYPDQFLDMKVSGDYVYILVQGQGLKIIDVTEPYDIDEIGSYVTAAEEIAWCNEYLYLRHYREIEILNITTPAAPVLDCYFASPSNLRIDDHYMLPDMICSSQNGEKLFILGKYRMPGADEGRMVILDTAGTYLKATFDNDTEGFTFAPDTFNGTHAPDYAEGSYTASGGYSGGGLRVYLKPCLILWSYRITSGGWSDTFSLDTPKTVKVSLHYRMVMGPGYEYYEFGEVLLTIDGIKYGNDVNTSIKHVNGNGVDDTGWLYEEIDVPLEAGNHTITIGGFNDRTTEKYEYIYVYLDDISITD